MENDLSNNIAYVKCSNDECECVASHDEYIESIDVDNVSSDYEEMDSRSSKLDGCT